MVVQKTTPIGYDPRVRKTSPIEPPLEEIREPATPSGSSRLEEIPEYGKKTEWKDLPEPKKPGFLSKKWGEVEAGAKKIVEKRATELGLKDAPAKRRQDDIARLERKIAALQKGGKRGRGRSRAPVPGGRPKRPWIQSRRAMDMAEPYDPMDELISTGEEMLDMGGMADPLAGGYGTSVEDIMDLGAEMMGGFGRPRQSRTKPKPKRKKGKRR